LLNPKEKSGCALSALVQASKLGILPREAAGIRSPGTADNTLRAARRVANHKLHGRKGAVKMSEMNAEQNSTAPIDPRSICNLMLDEAEGRSPLTNLALQKLLYFAHGLFLVETKIPLVSGYFEAWQYGPVHPAAYKAFKSAADRPIDFRASRINPLTGEKSPIPKPLSRKAQEYVRRVMATFGQMTPGRLVEVSHARGAPWWAVVDEARTAMAFGLRIPDDIILARFKHHKVSVGEFPAKGEPGEDIPFAA